MEQKRSSLSVFAIVPLGLEVLAHFELQLKFPDLAAGASVQKGGIQIEISQGREQSIFDLCHNLKIPTRLLLRISEFKCKDFPKMFQKVQNIKWRNYLCGGKFELSVSASQSRLNHEGRIEQTVKDGIARHFEKQPPKKVEDPFVHKIFVRVFDDLVTLSVDLSGDANFKRQYKELKAIAPLRENYAAAMYIGVLRELLLNREDSDVNEAIDIAVFDPVCGSGTLLFESVLFFESQKRDFSVFHLPILVGDVESKGATESVVSPKSAKLLVRLAVGCDQSPDSIENSKSTLRNIKKEYPEIQSTTDIRLEKCDLQVAAGTFNDLAAVLDKTAHADGAPLTHKVVRILLSNLPYGERIAFPQGPKKFIQDFLSQASAANLKAGAILVHRDHVRFVPAKVGELVVKNSLDFTNGGIPVTLIIFTS
jgi:23S rRNA G2445 N2-methylase RlmL